MSAARRKPAETWIATRALKAGGKRLVAKIGTPEQSEQHWRCPVALGKERGYGNGEDSVQALSNAMEKLRRLCLAHPGITYLDEFPAAGLRRTIPMILDESAVARIEAMIDKEERKYARDLRKAVEARVGKAAFRKALARAKKR